VTVGSELCGSLLRKHGWDQEANHQSDYWNSEQDVSQIDSAKDK